MKISTSGYKITTQRSLIVLQSPLPDWLSRACQGHHTRSLLHFAKEQRIEPPEGYQNHPRIRSHKTITFKVLSRERRTRQVLDTLAPFSFHSPFKREGPPLALLAWSGPASADKQVSPLAMAAPMLPATPGLLCYCCSSLDLILASGIHRQLLGSLPRSWVHLLVFTPRPPNPSTDSCSALPGPRGPSAFGVYPGLLWVTPAS